VQRSSDSAQACSSTHSLRVKALAKVGNGNASGIAGRSMGAEETSAFACLLSLSDRRNYFVVEKKCGKNPVNVSILERVNGMKSAVEE